MPLPNEQAQFLQNPVQFAKTISLVPDVGGVRSAPDFTILEITDKAEKVRHLSFEVRQNNERGALQVNGSTEAKTGRFPAWFLPWLPNKILKLKIPARGTTGDPDPTIFFTDAINGCTVVIAGDPAHPTIYHAGSGTLTPNVYAHAKNSALLPDDVAITQCLTEKDDPTLASNTNRGVPKFWRLILEKLQPGLTTDLSYSEVNKIQYVKDGTLSRITNDETTKACDDYVEWLERNQPELHLVRASPYGCVFGVRALDGKWAFYLQQNACLQYENDKGKIFCAVKPIGLRLVYPKGFFHNNQVAVSAVAHPFTPSVLILQGLVQTEYVGKSTIWTKEAFKKKSNAGPFAIRYKELKTIDGLLEEYRNLAVPTHPPTQPLHKEEEGIRTKNMKGELVGNAYTLALKKNAKSVLEARIAFLPKVLTAIDAQRKARPKSVRREAVDTLEDQVKDELTGMQQQVRGIVLN